MDSQQLDLYFNELKNELSNLIESSLSKSNKEVFTLKEAAEYLNVSFNTFQKFRFAGLKVFEFNGTKRVTKEELNKFIEKNSFKIGG